MLSVLGFDRLLILRKRAGGLRAVSSHTASVSPAGQPPHDSTDQAEQTQFKASSGLFSLQAIMIHINT